VGAPLCKQDPIGATTINRDAVLMLLKLRTPKQKIIFPNTNSGYGRMAKGVAYCDETSPLEPVSLYGILKIETEKALLEAGNAVVFRLATVCGIAPRPRLDLLVNDFVYRAVNDRTVTLFESHFKRNYIHVRDVAKAFMHAMKHFEKMKGEAYNVGLSNANLSKLELCKEIKKQVPHFVFVESKIGEDPDKRNYIISNKKIEKTGYKPDVSIQDAIAELIRGYQIIKRTSFANI
jgi:nucleoside-diphosphate-sugar epimerase